MHRIYSISFRRHKGFLLTEVLAGLMIVSMVVLLSGSNILTIFTGWRRMQIDGELLDAGRYMLTKIERHLTLEATIVTVTGNFVIDCQTEYPDKSTLIFIGSEYDYLIKDNPEYEPRGLFLNTTTTEGPGTNPLFIRDCMVSNWYVERINDKEILVSFTLNKDSRTKDFVRLFYCVNGVVENGS